MTIYLPVVLKDFRVEFVSWHLDEFSSSLQHTHDSVKVSFSETEVSVGLAQISNDLDILGDKTIKNIMLHSLFELSVKLTEYRSQLFCVCGKLQVHD